MENNALDQDTLAALRESTGDDPEFFAELIDTFTDEAPGMIATMRIGAAAGPTEGVRRAAHNLKSNAASFGALHLAEHCRYVEEAARGGDVARAAARLDALEAEYDRVAQELHRQRPSTDRG